MKQAKDLRLKVKSWYLLTCLLAYSLTYCLYGSAGTTHGDFLKVPVGARASAMGSAYTAVSDNAQATYWNPGGLTQMSNKNISFTHLQYVSGIRYGDISFAMPVGGGKKRVYGAELNTLYTEDNRRDTTGNKIGEFMNYNSALSVVCAEKLDENISCGISLKGIYLQLDDEQSGGVAVDCGALYDTAKKMKFGIVLQNLGPKIKFVDESAPLAINIRCGVSYQINEKFLVASDMMMPFEGAGTISVGCEYYVVKFLPVRVGYKYRSSGNNLGGLDGLSAGLGVSFKGYTLDYAFVPFGQFTNTHRFSFGMKF
ncbi:MAG: PorV/PorQ family protein [Elusimicrobiota bacterium]